MVSTAPVPCRPSDPGDPVDPVRQWYENELGWATVPGSPVRLVTGLRFDVLEVPAEAGFPALRHLGPASPVALHGERMRLLVAAGSAEELPGLLDWLEWGTLALDLTAIGAGGSIGAPPPPDPGVAVAPDPGAPASPGPLAPPAGFGARPEGRPEDGPRARPGDRRPAGPETRRGSRGAARWLRPPMPGRAVEPALPTLSALGGGTAGGGVGGAPDLVRLVQTMATQCHRVRLRRAPAQPLAFS
ncbi:SCO3374 family protein [Streptomyces sp. NBC_00151]|uniref:SCO3374 family protein n=1 Tax=Streptomyces sp. NBC_00151 TaxID=2975669 RepID=UPI002DDB8604|nr:SCO3374 family protein [Streptomyces sp. NBC_00151]WRZ40283.1 SCO3374 family protein [Streptomyces sp. NBC_00151]